MGWGFLAGAGVVFCPSATLEPRGRAHPIEEVMPMPELQPLSKPAQPLASIAEHTNCAAVPQSAQGGDSPSRRRRRPEGARAATEAALQATPMQRQTSTAKMGRNAPLSQPAPIHGAAAQPALAARPRPHDFARRMEASYAPLRPHVQRMQTTLAPYTQSAQEHLVRGYDASLAAMKRLLGTQNWSRAAEVGTLTAAACGISIAVGLLTAWLITPFFLSLTPPVGAITTMFNQIPFIGPVLTGLIQRGGPMGSLCSGLLLWCSQRALAPEGTTGSRRLNWALSAAVIGFAISPLAVPGVPISGALAATCLLGTGVMAYMTSLQLMPNSPLSGRWCLMGICFGLALAPLGAQASLGVSGATILGEALAFPVMGFLGIALQSMYAQLRPMMRDNLNSLAGTVQTRLSGLALDRPEVTRPTVFGAHSVTKLTDYFDACHADLAAKQSLGLRVVLLSGASGVGKTSIALSEIKRLNAHIEMPTLIKLRAGGKADVAFLEIIDKALERQRLQGRATVIFVPHCDEFFPPDEEADAELKSLASAAQTRLQLAPGDTAYNLLFVATTANPHRIKGAVMDRFTARFTVPNPDVATLKPLLLETIHREMANSFFVQAGPQLRLTPTWDLPGVFAALAASEAVDLNLSGREMGHYARALCQEVKDRYLHAQSALGAEAVHANAVVVQFDGDAELREAHLTRWPAYVADLIKRRSGESQASPESSSAESTPRLNEAGPSRPGQSGDGYPFPSSGSTSTVESRS